MSAIFALLLFSLAYNFFTLKKVATVTCEVITPEFTGSSTEHLETNLQSDRFPIHFDYVSGAACCAHNRRF